MSSKNRNTATNLAGRFSPEAQKYALPEGQQELNYLISTDILSEGQNLQDCGILINYDLHWNPVRMIQRNGRINRLGTQYKQVYVYNILPDSQLEEYLKLVHRLEGKINLIRNTIGTDTPVLDEEENPIEFTDAWKDIYSDDVQKRIEALGQAEQEADILLSEDAYVSDLKVFHHDPGISQEYKQNIYYMAMGKWAVMPQGVNRGDQRPEVLAFNRLYEIKDVIAGHAFMAMTRKGSDFHAITQLQVLEWLKTDKDNNARQKDSITADKVLLVSCTEKNVGAYVEEEEIGAPVGQQTEALRVMYDNHFAEDEIEGVRLAFQTTNVLDKQKIRKVARDIIRARKARKPYLDHIKKLVVIAKRTFSEGQEKKDIRNVKQVLFYVRENN